MNEKKNEFGYAPMSTESSLLESESKKSSTSLFIASKSSFEKLSIGLMVSMNFKFASSAPDVDGSDADETVAM